MLSVQQEVAKLIEDLKASASGQPHLERETTEIIPLAMAHALTFEGTSPSNTNLCAQISVVRALGRIPVSGYSRLTEPPPTHFIAEGVDAG